MAEGTLEDILPLSPLQEGLLFHAQFDDRAPDLYVIGLTVAVHGRLDVPRLRAAVEALLGRHPNLRAAFRHGRSGQSTQLIPRTVPLPWRELDLSAVTPEHRDAELAALRTAERKTRFDLAEPPALRFALVRLADEEHRLLFTSHHILLDGWSTPLLLRELFQLYAAGGDTATLPPVVPYRDYLGWLAKQDNEAAEARWRTALEGLEQATLLAPSAAEVAEEPSTVPAAPESLTLELDDELTAGLTAVARGAGLTMNTLVQGAWAVLLGALLQRDDVVFGSTVAGRPVELPGAESMIGLFINTVPVRVRLPAEEPFLQTLHRVQDEQSMLMASQHLGLAKIQRLAGLGPLFDTLTVFENYPVDEAELEADGLRVAAVDATDATHYPLTLVIIPGERLRLVLSYRPDVLERAEVSMIANRMRRLLQGVQEDPQRPIARLDVLPEDERTRVLVEWNDTRRDVTGAPFPTLLAEQVAATPDGVALRAGELVLSYAELAERTNRLAHLLIEHGVGPERVVALALPRGADAVLSLVAVLKAGGVALPLDPNYPTARLEFMLADAEPIVLVSTTELADDLPAGVPRLLLDDPATIAALAAAPADDPTPSLTAANAAYIIYTSGSTGRPKGVLISHAGWSSLAATAVDRFGVDTASRVPQLASLSFDVAVWEISMALLNGGCLVTVPDELRTAPEQLTEFAAANGLTQLAIPPSLLGVLPPDCPPPAGSTLLVGSEPVPAALVGRWSVRHSFVVAYGVTEAMVNSTLWTAPPGWAGSTVPIGRPDPNTRAYVLDRGLLPTPVGVPGELYLAGDGLARGYLGRHELTALRFVADPFGPPGSRMYRTGDVVRWSTDGDLEFLGRADDQLKIRGYRIEPGEIEGVLMRHPAVATAAVAAREDQPGMPRLIGYVVPTAPGRIGTDELRAHAGTILPDYLVPAAFVLLDELPLLPSGKLDSAALPAPEWATPEADDGEPRTDAERTLADLSADLLGLPRVGIRDNFFTIGGDSIVSIQLVSRARRAGLVITPRDVFQHKTVAAIAAAARDVQAGGTQAADNGVGVLPATPIMRWLQEHGGPIDRYNQAVVLRVPAGLDETRLAAVLQPVLDQHDALRALLRATEPGGEWELEVRPAGAVRATQCLHRVQADGLDDAGMLALREEQAAAAADRLDPWSGAMVQAVWLDAGRDEPGELVLVVHHLAVDGVSWRILLPDLAAAAAAERAGEPVRLDPVGTSMRQWVRLLHAEARLPKRVAELPYWTAKLGTTEALLGERALDPTTDTAATAEHLAVSRSVADTEPLLTTVPAAFHAGVNDVLLTALAVAVARWRRQRGRTEHDDVLLMLEGHGREELAEPTDLSRTVGWFTTTYPVRLAPGPVSSDEVLAGGPAAGQALKQVKEQLRSVPDNGIGYGMLRYLNPETSRVLSGFDRPQLGFNYLGRFTTGQQDGTEWSQTTEALGGSVDSAMPAAYPLEVNAITMDGPDGPKLSATWTWPSGVLSADAVQALADGWFAALDGLIKHATSPHTGGYTPSDLLVSLNQDDIDEFESQFGSG